MKTKQAYIAAREYSDWYNSQRWHYKTKQSKKIEISQKYSISVRTLERHLKEYYTLDRYKTSLTPKQFEYRDTLDGWRTVPIT